jgi:hypothetical protein
MIATESTLSRLLLGIEPMVLVEIYPLRCTKSAPLASRESLLYTRDIESIDGSASVINKSGDSEWSDHTISFKCRLRKSPNDILP